MSLRKVISFIVIVILVIAGLGFLFFRGSIPQHYFDDLPPCKVDPSLVNLDSAAYDAAVIKKLELAKPEDFRYLFKTFKGQRRDILFVNMRSDKDCFNVHMTVANWDFLQGMRITNGMSYPDELWEVKWKIDSAGGQKKVVFLDMHPVID